mmetsp:Transcript_18105/g.58639  ORF Transcript_18105/g.58639 Transcript_18105/m.58639 type:complete len:243 (-) Transcript_18105:365-1093(-)
MHVLSPPSVEGIATWCPWPLLASRHRNESWGRRYLQVSSRRASHGDVLGKLRRDASASARALSRGARLPECSAIRTHARVAQGSQHSTSSMSRRCRRGSRSLGSSVTYFRCSRSISQPPRPPAMLQRALRPSSLEVIIMVGARGKCSTSRGRRRRLGSHHVECLVESGPPDAMDLFEKRPTAWAGEKPQNTIPVEDEHALRSLLGGRRWLFLPRVVKKRTVFDDFETCAGASVDRNPSSTSR